VDILPRLFLENIRIPRIECAAAHVYSSDLILRSEVGCHAKPWSVRTRHIWFQFVMFRSSMKNV
jgi:hypothetical protein